MGFNTWMMKPKRFVELSDYFFINPIFYGLPVLNENSGVEEWRAVKDEIERTLAEILDDGTFYIILEYLGEPMRPDQKQRLHDDVTVATNKLKEQWESSFGDFNQSRLGKVITSYGPEYPDIDEIIQCSNLISF